MGKRKGYSIFRRNNAGPWYVAWHDGVGRRVKKASASKPVAHEIGRALASEADRVRTGIVDPDEAKAVAAGKESIHDHIEVWEKALKAKGNTTRHVRTQKNRLTSLAGLAGISILSQISSEQVQVALVGVSTPNNARHYLTAMRAFVRWCMQTGRLRKDPLLAVRPPNLTGEQFKRQSLSDTQLANLLDATETREAKTPFKSADRAMYYRVIAYSGLRRNEAASLVKESFDLKEGTITVEAAYSKRRRRDVIQLPTHLLTILNPWLKSKADGKPVFSISKHYAFERIFRADCKAAGIPVPKPGEPVRLGIHSLRRWYITNAVRSGGLAVAQEMARHSTPTLTKKYTDLTVRDIQSAVEKLPVPKAQRNEQRINDKNTNNTEQNGTKKRRSA